jgi:hypothetical protein
MKALTLPRKGAPTSEAFDRLAKRLADGSSRRDILKAVGGFLAGGLLLGFDGGPAAGTRSSEQGMKMS